MLVVFLTNMGSWSFNTKRLSHELEHEVQMAHGDAADHADKHQHLAHIDLADKDVLSDAEHSALHAASQFQPTPLATFDWQPSLQAGAIRFQFVPPPIAHATREPPFRPPRRIYV